MGKVRHDSHMKPEHLYYKEINARDGDYYRRWASAYGEYTAELVDQLCQDMSVTAQNQSWLHQSFYHALIGYPKLAVTLEVFLSRQYL